MTTQDFNLCKFEKLNGIFKIKIKAVKSTNILWPICSSLLNPSREHTDRASSNLQCRRLTLFSRCPNGYPHSHNRLDSKLLGRGVGPAWWAFDQPKVGWKTKKQSNKRLLHWVWRKKWELSKQKHCVDYHQNEIWHGQIKGSSEIKSKLNNLKPWIFGNNILKIIQKHL